MRFEAYWLSPSGELIGVPLSHIEKIIETPEVFGLTMDEIKAVFKKHKEKLGFEGNARIEIMRNLFKEGWVRFRYKSKSDSWVIEFWGETPENMARIESAKKTIISAEKRYEYSEFHMIDNAKEDV